MKCFGDYGDSTIVVIPTLTLEYNTLMLQYGLSHAINGTYKVLAMHTIQFWFAGQ